MLLGKYAMACDQVVIVCLVFLEQVLASSQMVLGLPCILCEEILRIVALGALVDDGFDGVLHVLLALLSARRVVELIRPVGAFGFGHRDLYSIARTIIFEYSHSSTTISRIPRALTSRQQCNGGLLASGARELALAGCAPTRNSHSPSSTPTQTRTRRVLEYSLETRDESIPWCVWP